MRIALRFAYDGRFPGYARQPEGDTVEDHVIAALRREGYVDGSWRTGSRTDRGVCAAMNVAACTLERPHLKGLAPALQRHLPEGIWVTGAAPVPDGFDPRKAHRTYAYHAPRSGEDIHTMEQACQLFVGSHDMRAFARIEDRDPVRHVTHFAVESQDEWWVFHVQGQSFLWNQVRRMVGAVVAVGQGHASLADIEACLASGQPHKAFGVAPAEGLLLKEVTYGLTWDPVAGGVEPRRLQRHRQEAAVRSALLDGLMAAGPRRRP